MFLNSWLTALKINFKAAGPMRAPWRLSAARRRRTSPELECIESLEERALLTTVVWQVGDGDWSVGANWSGGVVPAANDDVFIQQGSQPPFSVTHSAGTDSIKSLTSDVSLVISGGALQVNGQSASPLTRPSVEGSPRCSTA